MIKTAHSPQFSLQQALVLLLVFFSMMMSAVISRTVFERLPHLEDEVAYLFQAKTYAGGQLVVDIEQPTRAYWQPFVVTSAEDGTRFSKYTPGWGLVLALGVAMGAPWVVNALLSGLNVALVYRLGREIFSQDVGVIAAALIAFSPMALLLNASLMGHTAALFFTSLFFYGYWRIEQSKSPLRWGLVAGFALGMMTITRPLTAIGISAPFIVWSLYKLVRIALKNSDKAQLWAAFRPLLALAVVALLVSAAIPIYNMAAVGDPFVNLYTLVWPYDKIGFGEDYGRNGHNLTKGFNHVRFDLSLMAADLFGWQWGQITPEIEDHFLTKSGFYPLVGLSWVLLPFGLLAGWRKRWTWLLMGAAVGLITVHLAYWIGSQRYSTRYYFETLSALALISALPLAYLIRRIGPILVYGGLVLALAYSLFAYSIPRVSVLHQFNGISMAQIEAVQARRQSDQPVLVLVQGADSGEDRVLWRATGALMAVTSPYLDSDIVVARDTLLPGVREAILARFPDREVILMHARGNDYWFEEDAP
jgi:hypothetical protein